MIIGAILAPVLMAVLGIIVFQTLTKAHIANSAVHLDEGQMVKLASFEQVSQDIAKIKETVIANGTAVAVDNNRIRAVEAAIAELKLIHQEQAPALGRIEKLLIDMETERKNTK